ncbi:MAG: thymidine phosphorylase [Kiritimatiellae bacterium]|nr:thymidine phosphorylase [Kiritimatiellia bacterium]
MIAKLILDKKREGHALGSAEIREFVEGFTGGEIPDYQMSALAMAICCRGMNARETTDLTEAMMKSGRCLAWDVPTADKHSSGGVGDKLSLVIQPLAAACGVYVPSLTGRGLGITGGTADKLETIPGYNASLSLDDFEKVVKGTGVSMTVQTDEITPADKKLYALRDVTGTVASIPLITASILSKKLAEGAGTLVFDVKCGSGAFMKTREDAAALARSLVDGAKAAGRKAAALVTDMSAPLGLAVGNANEVAEALAWLGSSRVGLGSSRVGLGSDRGNLGSDRVKLGSDSVNPNSTLTDPNLTLSDPNSTLIDPNSTLNDPISLSVELAALMVSLTKEIPLEDARQMCRGKLADGSALAKFEAMCAAQGGDLDAFERLLKKPTFKFKIQAMKSGYITAIDAEKVGRVALALGAGRLEKTDKIDPLAGITLSVKRGDRVSVGSPLATLESSREPDGLERAAADLLKAFAIGPAAPDVADLVLERVE